MGSLGVIERLSTGLGVSVDTVVVTGGVSVEVVDSLKGNGVFGRVVANGSSIAVDAALGNIVRSLGTEEEAITTNNSVGSEGGTLCGVS